MGGGGVFNLDHFTLSDVPSAHDGITQMFEAPSTMLTAAGHTFRMERVGDIDGEFWSLDLLDPNTVIATQKSGAVWLFRRGQRIGPIAGTPAVHFAGQGGMLHVRAHPDYQRNGWIYLTFAEPSGEGAAVVGAPAYPPAPAKVPRISPSAALFS
jgi:glucose/arabinose dehydrogenase